MTTEEPPPYTRHVITCVVGNADITTEDGGTVKIAEFGGIRTAAETDMYMRLISYSEDMDHSVFNALLHPGARYRVTIERWETDTP